MTLSIHLSEPSHSSAICWSAIQGGSVYSVAFPFVDAQQQKWKTWESGADWSVVQTFGHMHGAATWRQIYGPGRWPAAPPMLSPQQPPPCGWPRHLRPSVKISYAILACWPRATYTLHNRIPPCSVHYCLNAHTVYLQRMTAHKVPLS